MPPWLLGIALAAPLAAAYLIVSPPSGDLAAATYRSDLFARAGFTIWDNGWYAGHALPAYSLLAPALGAWLGLRVLLALSAVLAAALFGLLASRRLPPRAARAATLAFAFGFCAELPSGRVPYDLGAAVALAGAIAIAGAADSDSASASESSGAARAATPLAATAALAILASAASPVAGAFLALAGVAVAIVALQQRRRSGVLAGAAAAVPALAYILLLALAFPEGGYEPFAAGAFWPELAAAVAIAALLPQGCLSPTARRTVRIGAGLYALALCASFLIRTPMGGNVVRLGAMFGAPIVVGVLWTGGGASPRARAGLSLRGRRNTGRLVLAMLAPLLLYWQTATAIDDQIALAGDPTVHASFYAPLRGELLRLAGGHPIRVEVPLTNAHWESAYLPGGPISIARGWERQLDTRYDRLFYRPRLSVSAYRRWLASNAISFVALPVAKLDSAGRQERRLIDSGPPYLRQVWSSARWRLFAVLGATPLAQPPARMLAVGTDSFTLRAPRAGSYEVRLRWTPYWIPTHPTSAAACVSRAPDGFTDVRVRRAGTVRVGAAFSLGRLFADGPRCAD
jgi:hypothetical protein